MKFKKSQVFMFDLILSFLILLIVISLTFNYYVSGNQNIDIYTINKNIIDGFTNTKINSLNDNEIRIMFANNLIRNVENTVAQQVVEFYNESNEEQSKNLTKIFVQDYIDKQMNFNITLENDTDVLYVLYNVTNRQVSFNDADLTSVTQRRIFTFKNTTTFYGPYIIKIRIWK